MIEVLVLSESWQLLALENQEANEIINRKLNRQISQRTQGLRFNLDIKKLGNRTSTVPTHFRRAVDFGVPAPGAPPETSLARYISIIERLHDEMQKVMDVTPDPDARQFTEMLIDATKAVEGLLSGYDDKTKALFRPILLNPLQIVAARLPPPEAITKFGVAQPNRFFPRR